MAEASGPAAIDLLIVGGGIAGLWLLNRATQAGHSALLLEKEALGAGQSLCAQGIIHGGTKYTLGGKLTEAANAIASMPGRWRACLEGSGEIDLRHVRLLSDATYLWPQDSFGARMTTLFASRAMRSRVDKVAAPLPHPFGEPGFGRTLYRLDEFVLHLPSLFEVLAAPVANRILRLDAAGLAYRRDGGGWTVTLPGSPLTLRARRIVITAGAGFEALAPLLGLDRPKLQRRPLHMVAMRHRSNLPVFGHCIGTATTPLVTVTTHPVPEGQIWYLGGGIAETGVERSEGEQIDAAREVVRKALPWLSPAEPEWATFRIDRAEPHQPGTVRPDSAFAEEVDGCIVAWPTKLALAPDLADRVLALLPAPSRSTGPLALPSGLPRPEIGRLPWEKLF